jgi:hypothetical protein
MQFKKTQSRIALCTCLVTSAFGLFTAQKASAIVWLDAYWNVDSANNFGRDHPSFQGVGRNGGCTGNLIYRNNRILTAAHCDPGISWTVRSNPSILVSSSVTKSGQDVRLVKLRANSGGKSFGMWKNTNEGGTGFLKAGHGFYGSVDRVGSVNVMGGTNPLAGTNTYISQSGTLVSYTMKRDQQSVTTAPGDSGGPALVKVGTGYEVSSTTAGFADGLLQDSRASQARAWVLRNL